MADTIIVFGGDGFCGWPTALYLSNKGFDVIIVDNFSRRYIDTELGSGSLTPISNITDRIRKWKELTGNIIRFEHINVANNYDSLLNLFNKYKPETVVHFAEQRSAPYSMLSSKHKCYTINNNINATHNILAAIVETGLDTHVIHLGTAGVYGYKDIGVPIPEGYLDVFIDTDDGLQKFEIVYPPDPGSIYHLTKTQDALTFQFYNKNDKLRITDLHQGVVWGCQTDETQLDETLINRFDYDGIYGTVLNRFLIQAVLGHPLTVYGAGGQTRAFIHIKDTVKCIYLAVTNPPNKGDKVQIFNQAAECRSIKDLATIVSRLTGAEIRYYKNPRNEALFNDLRFTNEGFKNLGWEPIYLEKGLLEDVLLITDKYIDNCDKSKIICTATWDKEKIVDYEGALEPVL